MTTRDLTLCAIYAALASIIGMIESFLPPLIPFAPGSKLGLANIVSLMALMTLTFKQTLWIVIIRVSVVALLVGQFNSFIFSLVGALCSLSVMALCKQLGPQRVSMVGVSIMGGLSHNIGQLAVASYIARSWLTFNYLPWLGLAGIGAGFITGLLANLLMERTALSEGRTGGGSQ